MCSSEYIMYEYITSWQQCMLALLLHPKSRYKHYVTKKNVCPKQKVPS